jgi:hypothetical protein
MMEILYQKRLLCFKLVFLECHGSTCLGCLAESVRIYIPGYGATNKTQPSRMSHYHMKKPPHLGAFTTSLSMLLQQFSKRALLVWNGNSIL